jgi:hypothetical protein
VAPVRSGQADLPHGVVEPGAFVAKLVEAAQRSGGLRWWTDRLNGGATEAALITPVDVAKWLHTLGLNSSDRAAALEAALSPQGMTLLADGLVLAGAAQHARLAGDSLLLRRGRMPGGATPYEL